MCLVWWTYANIPAGTVTQLNSFGGLGTQGELVATNISGGAVFDIDSIWITTTP